MVDTPHQPPALERLPTGIIGFDTILNGGLFQGGAYLVRGASGTGKTILANQLVFHHIQTGGRAVYVTLLTETHTRLFAYLHTLSFFRLDPIGDALTYLSASHVVESQNIGELHQIIRQAILNQQASMVVIDGMGTLTSLAPVQLALKQFTRTLQAYCETQRCTALLLHDAPEPPTTIDAVVDGSVDLYATLVDAQRVRELEVRKVRGSAFLEGRHQFEITAHGLRVYPRAEAVLRQTAVPAVHTPGRHAFGIPDLDRMLHGGVPIGSLTMLLGTSGSGRTMLGLHFLAAGAAAQEAGLYFGFNEPPSELVDKSTQVGLALDAAITHGMIQLLWQPAYENLVDALVVQLLDTVRQHHVRRLVIDGMEGFLKATYPAARTQSILAAVLAELRRLQVTTLFTLELHDVVSPRIEFPIHGVSMLADNMIFVRSVELRSQLHRLLSILKMRRSGYDTAIREFTITAAGINVARTFASAENILTGLARSQASTSGQEGAESD